MREGKCIIVSAGDFCPVDLNRQEGDFLIACDKGFHYLSLMGILPDLIVGDFDSLSEQPEDMRTLEEIRSQAPERILELNTHKDDTDTMKAIKVGIEQGYQKFFLYGALGGRRFDHTIANLQSLLYIKHHGGTGYIMEAEQMVLIAENETIHFHAGMQGMISVFAIGGKAEGVSLKGLAYSLDHGELTEDFPLGVSNEFIASQAAEITVEKGTLMIVARWDDAH